jgi:AcrR family transcriptional regulator
MGAPGKTKHDIVAEFRTAEILAAGRKVFAEKGFSEATMDRIAEVAGLAKGTLYLYFASKRDVYFATVRKTAEELDALSSASMSAQTNTRASIRAFIQTRLEFFEGNREFFSIYYAEFGNILHPSSPNHPFHDFYVAQLGKLETLLSRAVEQGEIRAIPVEAVAASIFEITRGWMLRRLSGSISTPVAEDIDTLTNILWQGIRP